MNLLQTIRVPKNLLYLTDRLPKPNYNSEKRKMRNESDEARYRTYEGPQLLPNIRNMQAHQNNQDSDQGSQERMYTDQNS